MADQQKPQEGSQKPQEGSGKVVEDSKKAEPHSHVLLLADGSRRLYAVDDLNPHGPLPSEVDGIPVVGSVHAYEQRESE